MFSNILEVMKRFKGLLRFVKKNKPPYAWHTVNENNISTPFFKKLGYLQKKANATYHYTSDVF